LIRSANADVDRLLGRFGAVVTRVEIHLSDVNGQRNGRADKRCLVEARPAGSQPLSVSGSAATVEAAIVAALKKMQRALTAVFGRRAPSPSSGGSADSARTTRPKSKKVAAPATPSTSPRPAGKRAAGKPSQGTTGAAASGTRRAGPSRAVNVATSRGPAATGTKPGTSATRPAPPRRATKKSATAGSARKSPGGRKRKPISLARRKAWPRR
jgi:hypothetical protein